MRCGRTLHKEQDLIHAGVDELIDKAGAGLGTADNSLAGFDPSAFKKITGASALRRFFSARVPAYQARPRTDRVDKTDDEHTTAGEGNLLEMGHIAE